VCVCVCVCLCVCVPLACMGAHSRVCVCSTQSKCVVSRGVSARGGKSSRVRLTGGVCVCVYGAGGGGLSGSVLM